MPPEQQPVTPEKPKLNFFETDLNKNFTPKFLLLCAGLLIVGLSIAGYYKLQAFKSYQQMLVLTAEIEKEQIAHAATSTWQTYRNEEYGFEVKYPKEWWIDYQIFTKSISESTLAVGNGVSSNLKCDVWLYFDDSKPHKDNLYTNESERKNCDSILDTVISTFKFTK